MTTYKIKSIKHDTVQTDIPEEDAARFLRISVPKLREKAQYREPVRGAWYVEAKGEIPPEQIPDKRINNAGFTEQSWNEFREAWRRACAAVGAYLRVDVKWIGG